MGTVKRVIFAVGSGTSRAPMAAAVMKQMAQGMANLQEVNEKLMATQSQRGAGGMYPTEEASDNAIPEGAGI